jgi:uncharacterized protein YdhG (YjbR/CyaY superfamily)
MTHTAINDFLAALPGDRRTALESLQARIRALVPEATERISYGVPAFFLDGHSLVSVGAARTHCSFYVQSTAVINAFADELRAAGFRVTAGSVLFQPDQPIPDALVQRLVRARVEAVRARKRR